ncbi:hypothetical protein CLCAR_3367 [Clostridium carboxidivorans P7]|nr:hypothetical protein CLCAR_3367 [Clostridium carboxidivorans P7]
MGKSTLSAYLLQFYTFLHELLHKIKYKLKNRIILTNIKSCDMILTI